MAEIKYINLDTAYDMGTLVDWYISSVGNEPPVWTKEHLEELLNDFYVIPKDTPLVGVAPVKHGTWLQKNANIFECSECEYSFDHEGYLPFFNYCPSCGAEMDKDKR